MIWLGRGEARGSQEEVEGGRWKVGGGRWESKCDLGRGGARGSPERKGGEFCHFRVGVHRETPGPSVLATGGDRVLRE